MAKNITPTDEIGISDPFIRISCGDTREISTIKFNTLNPGWFETITMSVKIPTNIPSGISLTCYDHEDNDPN
jgi:Ca2+-dependent lipid-binding protein